MATYYVTSADVGAPALSGQNGAMVAVTDFILNTTAGLTIAFTATNRRVYTMPDGGVLQVYHDSSVTGDARLCLFRPAESASSVSSFTDQFPTVALVADTACNVLCSTTANSTARAWYAVVDTTNNVFILVIQADGGSYVSSMYVYGGKSALPSDSYGVLTFGRNSTSPTNVTNLCFQEFSSPFTNNNLRLWIKRSRDGTVKSTRGHLAPYGGSASPFLTNGPTYPDPDDAKLRLDRVYVSDQYSQTSTAGAATEEKRLWVPHLWVPRHGASAFGGFAFGEEFTWGAYDAQVGASAKFRIFQVGNSAGSAGAWIIETTNTWSAPAVL